MRDFHVNSTIADEVIAVWGSEQKGKVSGAIALLSICIALAGVLLGVAVPLACFKLIRPKKMYLRWLFYVAALRGDPSSAGIVRLACHADVCAVLLFVVGTAVGGTIPLKFKSMYGNYSFAIVTIGYSCGLCIPGIVLGFVGACLLLASAKVSKKSLSATPLGHVAKQVDKLAKQVDKLAEQEMAAAAAVQSEAFAHMMHASGGTHVTQFMAAGGGNVQLVQGVNPMLQMTGLSGRQLQPGIRIPATGFLPVLSPQKVQ